MEGKVGVLFCTIRRNFALNKAKEGEIMATSTFGKQFAVKPEKAHDFVKEMTKKVAPTLSSDFKTHLKHEKDLKENLRRALK